MTWPWISELCLVVWILNYGSEYRGIRHFSGYNRVNTSNSSIMHSRQRAVQEITWKLGLTRSPHLMPSNNNDRVGLKIDRNVNKMHMVL
jgi:hypothetical protein